MEPFYPLHAYVCANCLLVQLDEYVSPDEIFSDYAYFSSYSESWVAHAARYAKDMQQMLGLSGQSLVMEIASNDGYLLQHFAEAQVPVLGIEPAANVAEHAVKKGIPTVTRFFGQDTARDIAAKHGQPDLLLGNNVLAHVPDINDFVGGMAILLKPDGVITMEFPHLLRLMEENQFDTIYHEHFSYLSLLAVNRIFAFHGLKIFDVQELPTHGGSLRIFAAHAGNEAYVPTENVARIESDETSYGLKDMATYGRFSEQVKKTKRDILRFLIDARDAGKTVVGYGAPGKGNTLLNYCGIRTDLLDYTVDLSPHKQGRFTPGTRIPIYDPEVIAETKPDYLFILPWNLSREIRNQTSYISEWGGRWVVPIPQLSVLEK